MGRARGLNGEPRNSSQFIAIGLIAMLFFPPTRFRFISLIFCFIAFLFTASLSGMVYFVTGLIIWWFLRGRFSVYSWFLIIILLIVPLLIDIFSSGVFAGEGFLVTYFLEKFDRISNVGVLEIFDRTAVDFFIHNPYYLIFGAGPGLISLPATEFMNSDDISLYGDRIDSIPHMGIIQIISNCGIFGLLLFSVFLSKCLSRLRLASYHNVVPISTYQYSIVLIVLYFLQANLVLLILLAPLLAIARSNVRLPALT
jgi:hypothetical protein